MQVPVKKLLRLLEADQPAAVRCAAALVFGELGLKDAELARALAGHVQDADAAVRLAVIDTVARLRIEQALPQLLARLREGGEGAAEAAQAAARLGARATRALQELMHQVAPGLRRYIAAALAASGTPSAETATVEVLLDKDPGVIEAAVRSLLGQVPALSGTQRQALARQLLSLLRGGKVVLSPASEAALVRVLAGLDDPEAAAVLWDRTLPPSPPETRAAALQALGRWVHAPGKDQLQRLFRCALDADFRVAAPALLILKGLPVTERTAGEWLELFRAPDVAVRQLALEKVGDRDRADIAAALLEQLDHADRGLREKALTRLAQLEQGRKALAEALLEAESPDRAWTLARAQAPLVKDFPPKWGAALFARASKYLEAGDRRADALLFLLRQQDAAGLQARLEERALALRKKKDYATALLYLRLLAQDPALGFPTRWELAGCGLKVSARELTAEARAADPALQQFAALSTAYEPELSRELEKAKWLGPDDLYYLGFHLAEKDGPPKRVGGKVLHLVVKRAPRTKLGQAARAKLRSEGLQ